jgi:hypothetical protein
MVCAGTYVTGLEPANCWVEGRDRDRERGILQFLEPGETREYSLELTVLDGQEALAAGRGGPTEALVQWRCPRERRKAMATL